MIPEHTHLTVLPDLLPNPVPPYPPKKRRKREKYQVQFMWSLCSLEHDQTPGDQPLKENSVLPHPLP